MTLDVTMTAVCRPDVLKRTLKSFKENLFGEAPLRLIINIDPVGETKRLEEMIGAVHSLLTSNVLWRMPETPCFPKAFRWAWRASSEKYIFHLEDDWELFRKVDLDAMLALMEKHKDLAVLRLPYNPCEDTNKSWGHFLPWNGEFYEVPEDLRGLLGFCGHPSLIRRSFIEIALNMLSDHRNPEKSIKWRKGRKGYGEVLQKFRYGVFGKPGEGLAVGDIGAGWAGEHGWKKKGQKAFFCEWEKIDG